MSMHVEQEFGMKTISRTSSAALLIAVACGLGGCAGMTTRERNTVTGAAIGGVAGNVLSGGSTGGTVGGAVAGGIIGHEWERIRR